MHATIYGRGQMVIPSKARKDARIEQGDIVEVRPEGDGRILLLRLVRPKEPARIKVKFKKRKGRHTVASTGKPITSEQVRGLLNELT
jgi:AbrB family looped-hinge helix DNA binding protein